MRRTLILLACITISGCSQGPNQPDGGSGYFDGGLPDGGQISDGGSDAGIDAGAVDSGYNGCDPAPPICPSSFLDCGLTDGGATSCTSGDGTCPGGTACTVRDACNANEGATWCSPQAQYPSGCRPIIVAFGGGGPVGMCCPCP